MQKSLKKMAFSFEVIDWNNKEIQMSLTDKTACCEYINLNENTYPIYLMDINITFQMLIFKPINNSLIQTSFYLIHS